MKPLIAYTMGDVAGIGPEVLARGWERIVSDETLRPLVIGCDEMLRRACRLIGRPERAVARIERPVDANPAANLIPCLSPSEIDVSDVPSGQIDARAGRAAHEWLIAAADMALEGQIDAIVTLPLNKEGLHAAGVAHPGHTEVLAERCGVREHAMMLFVGPPIALRESGVGVVHTTLHMSLRKALDALDAPRVVTAIGSAHRAMHALTGGRSPRIAVAGLNPHAGEHGLFGGEEDDFIAPAIAGARGNGIDAIGPVAADAVFRRALDGEFDAVVAMYHDQGHVALKTLAFRHAVNVTVGLPIVRTSVAHGTAYDIAWQGHADATSLIEATRVAARLVAARLRGDVVGTGATNAG